MNEYWDLRKEQWNYYISRMTKNRLVRITVDKYPSDTRSKGLPRERWDDNVWAGHSIIEEITRRKTEVI